MKIYLQAFFVTLIGAAIFVGAFKYWRDQTAPKEAEQKIMSYEEMEKNGLPDFSGKTLQGEALKLLDFKGKTVVLNFWASWCGPCVEEFPSLLKLAEEMKGQMVLVAVSGDSSAEEIHSFLKQVKDWDKPWIKIVWDSDRKIEAQYDVDRLPESFIQGPNQKLAKKISGSINWYTPDSVRYMQELDSKK